MNNPLKAGVTGGIGSGKSLVCRIFSVLGVPVYDADRRAKWLMTYDETLIRGVKKLFGSKAYSDNTLNRSFLAQQTFHDPDMVQKLNALVHPAVGRDFEAWLREQDAGYVIKEAALLIESGSYRELDYLITVEAPEDIRITRVLERDPQRDREQVMNIISNQLSDADRRSHSDLVIVNDNREMIIPQVIYADRLIRNLVG